MSLDVYLIDRDKGQVVPEHDAIFIRKDGQTIEVTREEWDERHPGRSPVSVHVPSVRDQVYTDNITHNLNEMARQAGIYMHLWRPEEIGVTKARELIHPLTDGLVALVCEPERFKKLDPPNGWGSYDGFVSFVKRYLEACMRYPWAFVEVCR